MGSIKGIVKDSNNVPMEGVNMVILNGPTHPDIAALTDSYGMFAFSDLNPGNYTIKAYSRVESDDISLNVFVGKTAFVEISMETDLREDKDNVIDEI